MMMQIMGDFDGRRRTAVMPGRKTKSFRVLVLSNVLREKSMVGIGVLIDEDDSQLRAVNPLRGGQGREFIAT